VIRHLALRDFVIVTDLELALGAGFTALTGETGAGKSILIDALQLALGARAEALVVREGAARAEIAATFDTPPALRGWLDAAGFAVDDELLLRRVVDAGGKSRAYINGSPATAAQLREAAEHLVDIHGQHAWQGLTRPAQARALLDAQAGGDAAAVAQAFAQWRAARDALDEARAQQGQVAVERERLLWQIGEVERLAPGADEWPALNAEHQVLAHGQALLDGTAEASRSLDDEATRALARAAQALQAVVDYDARLAATLEAVHAAQTQVDDAARELHGYLARSEPDPARLAEVDQRLSAWVGLARRFRQPPEHLPALLADWQAALRQLDAQTDLDALQAQADAALATWRAAATALSKARRRTAPRLAARITEAMQQLGMAGGRFDIGWVAQDAPQAFGLESVEFLVAGHAGSAPRPLAKVASGGELSRLALAIAVTTAEAAGDGAPATLIFDEIDSGIGGDVADAVGRLLRRLGGPQQVLAVTHLPQVAASAHQHLVVSKQAADGQTTSQVAPATAEARVTEIARMLAGHAHSATGRAHARELIARHAA